MLFSGSDSDTGNSDGINSVRKSQVNATSNLFNKLKMYLKSKGTEHIISRFPKVSVGYRILELYLLAIIVRLSARRRFYQMVDVVDLHDAALDKRIYLFDCDHLGQNVAQPLRIQEIIVSQCCVIVVQQNSILVQEHGRLLQFGCIPERFEIQEKHFLVHHLLEILLI